MFILAGVVAATSLIWDDLGPAARVIISFGPGLVLLILGVATLKDPRYVRAATPLFVIAGLLQPTGLFVILGLIMLGVSGYAVRLGQSINSAGKT